MPDRKRGTFKVHGVVVGRFRADRPLPQFILDDMERIRAKHEDNDFGTDLQDQQARDWEDE